MYVSFDGGDLWHEMRGSFPRVPVDDIAIHPRDNDLILGTYGRSIWVLDDIKPLENLSDAVLAAKLHVFPIRDAINYRLFHYKGHPGHKVFLAKNPPQALIHYYLSEPEAVHVTVTDANGQVVRTIEGSNNVGLNRTNWDLRYDEAIPTEPTEGSNNPPPSLEEGRQNGNLKAINLLRPRVLPGTYTVQVEAGSESAERTVIVTDDPNVRASDADRRAHLDALLELRRLISEMHEAHEQAAALTEQLNGLEATLDDAPETVATAFAAAKTSVSELERLLSHDEGQTRFGGATRPLYEETDASLWHPRHLHGSAERPTAGADRVDVERAVRAARSAEGRRQWRDRRTQPRHRGESDPAHPDTDTEKNNVLSILSAVKS